MRLSGGKKYAIALVVAVMAVFMAGALFACGGQGSSGGGQSAVSGKSYDDLKAAFRQDKIFEQGVASNMLVEESPYEVTDFVVSEETETENGFEYKIDAVIENANFASNLSLTCERRGEIFLFDLVDSSTTAKKGIDFDQEHGIDGVESVLAEDGKSCTVFVESPYDYWFIEGKTEATYTYKFDGHAWTYEGVRPGADYTFKKDVEGEYLCPAGESPQYTDFTISDFDSDKGTFSIKFTQEACAIGVSQCQEAHVELTGGITPEECTENTPGRMDNGMLYSFKAQGSSDLGGQVAEMEGYFGVDAEGNPTITLTKSKVDTIGQGTLGDPYEKQIAVHDYVMTK